MYRQITERIGAASDPALRMRSRLLGRMLLLAPAVGGAGILTYRVARLPAQPLIDAALVLEAAGIAVFAVLYLLNRSGYYRLAVWGALFGFSALVFTVALQPDRSDDTVRLFLYLLVPMLISCFFLTGRQTAAFFCINIWLMLVLAPVFIPGAAYAIILDIAFYLTLLCVLLAAGIGFTNRLEQLRRRQLEQSEEKYRMLAENMDDVVYIQGLDAKMQYLSPSAARVFGRPLPELAQRVPQHRPQRPRRHARRRGDAVFHGDGSRRVRPGTAAPVRPGARRLPSHPHQRHGRRLST